MNTAVGMEVSATNDNFQLVTNMKIITPTCNGTYATLKPRTVPRNNPGLAWIDLDMFAKTFARRYTLTANVTHRGHDGAQEHVQIERYLVRKFGGVGVEARGHVSCFGAVEEAWLLVQNALEQHLCEAMRNGGVKKTVLLPYCRLITFRTRTLKRAICQRALRVVSAISSDGTELATGHLGMRFAPDTKKWIHAQR